MTNANQPVATTDTPARHRTIRIAAITLIVGSLCPWATFVGLASMTGLQLTYGWITVAGGAIILALGSGTVERRIPARHQGKIIRGTSGLCVLACGLILLDVGRTEYGAAIQPAWGIYLTLGAALIALLRGAGRQDDARGPATTSSDRTA
jgi:hypothetical protein